MVWRVSRFLNLSHVVETLLLLLFENGTFSVVFVKKQISTPVPKSNHYGTYNFSIALLPSIEHLEHASWQFQKKKYFEPSNLLTVESDDQG